MNVPYFDLKGQIQSVRGELDRAIAEQLDNGSFCLGPAVESFEKAFAAYTGARYALGFNSGTSALHVATRILNLGAGDEVISTPYTFVATSWAIVYTNAKPVYVDIDPGTMNLDPAKIEAAITPRTKAIMPVHLYGHPCDLDPILRICAKHKLALIEDAAQAHGAKYKGTPVGTFGQMSGFSFYPGKNLGACGEGGALVTNDAAIYKRAKALREHGSYERYYHEEIGYNYRMEGIQGAALGVKLRHLTGWTARRRELAHRYHSLLAGTPLTLPVEASYGESVYHLYVIRHAKRDALREFLTKRGIGSALHYPLPCHLQKCFASLGHKVGDFPVAEQAARECLSLPIFPEMTNAQQDAVAAAIKDFFRSAAASAA
jgi:dTDP-4-amino-4,6-dideoxygalactose transaminase